MLQQPLNTYQVCDTSSKCGQRIQQVRDTLYRVRGNDFAMGTARRRVAAIVTASALAVGNTGLVGASKATVTCKAPHIDLQALVSSCDSRVNDCRCTWVSVVGATHIASRGKGNHVVLARGDSVDTEVTAWAKGGHKGGLMPIMQVTKAQLLRVRWVRCQRLPDWWSRGKHTTIPAHAGCFPRCRASRPC